MCNELRNIDREGMFSVVMSFHPIPTPEPRRLVAALLEVQSAPDQVFGLGAYSEESCFEFHQLLVAAIFGFGETLELLHKHRHLPCMERARYIQMVVQLGNLLWRIADSRILGHHLTLLQSGSFLSTPSPKEKEVYRTFASFVPLRKASSKRPTDFGGQPTEVIDGGDVSGKDTETEASKEEKGGHEGDDETETSMGDKGDRKAVSETETTIGDEGEAENVGETEEGQWEEEDDIGQEVKSMIEALPIHEANLGMEPSKIIDRLMAGKALMFQRWLRLLVNHWAALDIISAHGSKSSHDIQIKLITARHPDTYADQGMKMNPWRDTIRWLAAYLECYPNALAPGTKFDADACISMLEKYLEHKTPHHTLINAFNYEPENPNNLSGTYHCEAVLAVIIYLGLNPKGGYPSFLDEV